MIALPRSRSTSPMSTLGTINLTMPMPMSTALGVDVTVDASLLPSSTIAMSR
jgi:hypothetical protein